MEKRWKRAALLLTLGLKEPGLKGPNLLGKEQLRESKCWGILRERKRWSRTWASSEAKLECCWGFIRYGFLIPSFAVTAAYRTLQICVATTQLQTAFLGIKEPRTIHCLLLGVRLVQNNTATAVEFSGICLEIIHSFSSIKVPSSGSIPLVPLSLFHQFLQVLPCVYHVSGATVTGVVTTWPCLGTEAAAAALLAGWQLASGWTGAVGLWRGACSPGSCCHHPALQPVGVDA